MREASGISEWQQKELMRDFVCGRSRRIHRGRRVGRAREPPDIKAPREVISEGKLVLNGRKRRGDELDLYLHWGRAGVGGQRKGNRVVAREGLRKRKTFSKGSGRKIEEERSKRKPRASRENGPA